MWVLSSYTGYSLHLVLGARQKNNGYWYLDIVLLFVFGYADTWMGSEDISTFNKIHFHYTELNNLLMSYNYSTCWSTKDLDDILQQLSTFKKAVWGLFGPHCGHGMNTVNFYLLDHLVDYMRRFGTIQVHFVVKQEYASISNLLKTRTSETVSSMDSTLQKQWFFYSCKGQQPSASELPMQCVVQHRPLVWFQSLLTLTNDLVALNFYFDRFCCALYNSLQSNSFPQVVRSLKETITNKERPILPSSVQCTMVQSCPVHGRFCTALFDSKKPCSGSQSSDTIRK